MSATSSKLEREEARVESRGRPCESGVTQDEQAARALEGEREQHSCDNYTQNPIANTQRLKRNICDLKNDETNDRVT